jgi:hypothetical protein
MQMEDGMEEWLVGVGENRDLDLDRMRIIIIIIILRCISRLLRELVFHSDAQFVDAMSYGLKPVQPLETALGMLDPVHTGKIHV